LALEGSAVKVFGDDHAGVEEVAGGGASELEGFEDARD